MLMDRFQKKTLDLPFQPYDDISYHPNDEEDKHGVRCVAVIPNGMVKTRYVDRTFMDIMDVLAANRAECSLMDIYSDTVWYTSNGRTVYLNIIYLQYGETSRKQCCVEYDGEPLVYANGCIITGDNFTDLTMDQCYGLVTSARAKEKNGDKHVCVNITENMDLVPRLILDEE